MNKFKEKETLDVGVWYKNNINTDIIIPSDYLKVVNKKGLGEYLFDSFRFKDKGKLGKKATERIENKDFFLNKEAYRDAKVLITGDNFGSGSSREHAPWALIDYGFRVIIAPSFANIFYENAFKNGLLLIKLDKDEVKFLSKYFDKSKKGKNKITVDLKNQKVIVKDKIFNFELNQEKKRMLLLGLDEISEVLINSKEDIKNFEIEQQKKYPFLYNI